MARQKQCEKATALTIFYFARPGQMPEFDRDKIPEWQLDVFDLVSEIRRRFLDGFYERSTIAFDGEQALRDEAYLPEDATDDVIRLFIPEVMRASLPGRTLGATFDVEPEAWV
jgi:hypothetical protein